MKNHRCGKSIRDSRPLRDIIESQGRGGKRSIVVSDNKSRVGYGAFTRYIIGQSSKGLSRSAFYDFITVQFVRRDKNYAAHRLANIGLVIDVPDKLSVSRA